MSFCVSRYARCFSAFLIAAAIGLSATGAAAQELPEPPPPPVAAAPPAASGSPGAAELAPPPPSPPGAVTIELPPEPRQPVRGPASAAPQRRPAPAVESLAAKTFAAEASPAGADTGPHILNPTMYTGGLITLTLSGFGAIGGSTAIIYECISDSEPVNGTGLCPGQVGDIGRVIVGVSVVGTVAGGLAMMLSLDLDPRSTPGSQARTTGVGLRILVGAGAMAARWSF